MRLMQYFKALGAFSAIVPVAVDGGVLHLLHPVGEEAAGQGPGAGPVLGQGDAAGLLTE